MGSHPISLDNGLILLVFGSSFRLTPIQHRLVQYPEILDGYPSNKIYMYTSNLGMEYGNMRIRLCPCLVNLLSRLTLIHRYIQFTNLFL